MRKSALLVAVVLAAALSSSSSYAAGKADPAIQAQKDTNAFIAAAFNPMGTGPAATHKAKKHAKKKKM